jgi:putative colanic acid biosynthesis glycosyltransferase
MKIALIDVNFGGSSTGKIVSDISANLFKSGNQSVAYFGRGKVPKASVDGEAIKICKDYEVYFNVLTCRLTGRVDPILKSSNDRLVNFLNDFKPDIIHLHDLHGYFINIENLVDWISQTKIPTVWTFHCDYMFTGRCGFSQDCDRWITGCQKCPHLSRYPGVWFFDQARDMYIEKQKLFANLQRLEIVSPSKWLAGRIKRSFLSNRNISVIPNGLDVDIFKPRITVKSKWQAENHGRFCVISVGANLMSNRKGGHWVLELAKRFISRDIDFVMVGVDSIPKFVPPNVTIYSSVKDQQKLAEYYSMGDVLLLTSTVESFSMVTAEALACGLPVIGFKAGAPEEVAPTGFGFFVQYGDLDQLERILNDILEKKIVMKSAEQCVEFARHEYSSSVMAKRYQNLYLNMLNSEKGL